jgi:hypothetical protein
MRISARTKSCEPLDPGSTIIRPDHLIEKEAINFNELEHALIEKVEQLFRDML